tara:strand:+ start:183 stop:305 length:123 start_codon:yes stop_codon:yes gene_type:complete
MDKQTKKEKEDRLKKLILAQYEVLDQYNLDLKKLLKDKLN